jgi:DNA topoisomerase-1
MNLVNSQQARRFLDRLVGYKLSPILWKKVRRGLSAGRVQSVAVRLIVDREGEIEKHVPQEYWQIKVEVKSEKGTFWIELAKIKVEDTETAKTILADLEKSEYVIKEIKKSERKASPNAPFKTSTLQQAAANVLGWPAKRTMSVAQKLYEQGDITYHRTDSFNLAPTAIEAVREYIGKEFGMEYLPKTPRIYKTGGKVVAQEAHEAVRPTHFEVSPDKYGKEQTRTGEEEKLYNLIWRRTLACQMAEAVFDDTRVVVETTTPTQSTESGGQAKTYQLTANGAVEKFAGWKKVMPSKEKDDLQKLPELREVSGEEKGGGFAKVHSATSSVQ